MVPHSEHDLQMLGFPHLTISYCRIMILYSIKSHIIRVYIYILYIYYIYIYIIYIYILYIYDIYIYIYIIIQILYLYRFYIYIDSIYIQILYIYVYNINRNSYSIPLISIDLLLPTQPTLIQTLTSQQVAPRIGPCGVVLQLLPDGLQKLVEWLSFKQIDAS